MKGLTFRAATENDWQQVGQLLCDVHLPLNGAEAHLRDFLLAYQGPTLAGCAALERYGEAALLRSVATDEAFRGIGLGQALVRQVIESARHEGIKTIVLMTTTADQFYPRFGFNVIRRDEAPEAVKVSEEFQGACPDSAVTMQLKLG